MEYRSPEQLNNHQPHGVIFVIPSDENDNSTGSGQKTSLALPGLNECTPGIIPPTPDDDEYVLAPTTPIGGPMGQHRTTVQANPHNPHQILHGNRHSDTMMHKKLSLSSSDAITTQARKLSQADMNRKLSPTVNLQRSHSARCKRGTRLSQSPQGRSTKPLQSSPKQKPSIGSHVTAQRPVQRTQSAHYKELDHISQRGPHEVAHAMLKERKGSVPSSSLAHTSPAKQLSTTTEPRQLKVPDAKSYERLRNFSIEKGHLVNRGDSFRRRDYVKIPTLRLEETANVYHPTEHTASTHEGGSPVASQSTTSTSAEDPKPIGGQLGAVTKHERFNVCIIGAKETGKSSLLTQFMSSEYANPFNDELDTEHISTTVSVLLQKEESELTFTEEPLDNATLINPPDTDGYVLMYAVNNKESFRRSEEMLQRLTLRDGLLKPLILTANKVDLARKKVVSSEEAAALAKDCDAKFIEISVALNHNIDELLVGLLTELRLRQQEPNGRKRSLGPSSPLLSPGAYRRHSRAKEPRKLSGSGCTQTLLSAKNSILSCLIGKRRARSADQLAAFEGV